MTSKIAMKSFVHPEQLPGEVFLGNIYYLSDKAIFKYKTVRAGREAIRFNGTIIPGAWPVFACGDEVERKSRRLLYR